MDSAITDEQITAILEQDALVRIAHPERVGIAKHVVVVVGRDAAAAAVKAAPTDAIIVAVAEVADLRASGVYSPVLAEAIRPEGDSTVTILLGDHTARQQLWIQSGELAEHFKVLGVASVTFARCAAGADLAATLAAVAPERQAATFAGILKEAKPTRGSKPARDKQSGTAGGVVVDWLGGRIVRQNPDVPGMPMELANFAMRRISTAAVFDDDAGASEHSSLVHEVEIACKDGASGLIQTHIMHDVRDADLCDYAGLRRVLARIPGGRGSGLIFQRIAADEILNAIRVADSDLVNERQIRGTTGIIEKDGRALFIHPGGAIGAEGETGLGRARVSINYRGIAFPDPALLSAEDEKLAAFNSMCLADEIGQHAWGVAFGTLVNSLAGMPVGAVPFILGLPGSGKTTYGRAIGAHLSPAFGLGPKSSVMHTVDSTSAMAKRFGAGLDSLMIVVDDARQRGGKKDELQQEVVESLIRRGYSGMGAGDSALSQTADGKWDAVLHTASPAVLMIGERIPVGLPASTLERLLPIRVEVSTAFKSGTAAAVESYASNTLPHRHLAALIRWLMARIDASGGFDNWIVQQSEVRQSLVERFDALAVSPRLQRTMALPAHGMLLWHAYLIELGLVTSEQRDAYMDSFFTKLVSEMLSFTSVGELSGGHADPGLVAIEQIKVALAVGGALIDKPVSGSDFAKLTEDGEEWGRTYTERGAQVVLARRVLDGETFYGVIPTTALALPGLRSLYGGNAAQLVRDLAPHVTKSQQGRGAKYKIRIGAALVDVVLLPAHLIED